MSEVLAEYNSKSNLDKKYRVIRGKDGKIYCDCWGWKRTRNCAHLEHYKQFLQPNLQHSKVHQVDYTDDKELLSAISQAISELR